MRRNYLVLQRVEDMKKSAGSYAVVSVVNLDERVVRGVDSIPISKHLAETFRELVEKHVKPER